MSVGAAARPSPSAMEISTKNSLMAPRLLFGFCVALSCVIFVEAFAPNCTTCPDHAQQCCDGSVCCDMGAGSYGCCSSTETCCKGTCCIEQTTFCCPKDAIHPDRCCPRWTVCCTDGERFRFGCLLILVDLVAATLKR